MKFNIRCLEGVDPKAVAVQHYDGRSICAATLRLPDRLDVDSAGSTK